MTSQPEKSYTVVVTPSYEGDDGYGLVMGTSELDIKALDPTFALKEVIEALQTATFAGGNLRTPTGLTIEVRLD